MKPCVHGSPDVVQHDATSISGGVVGRMPASTPCSAGIATIAPP